MTPIYRKKENGERYQVQGVLRLSYQEIVQKRPLRRYQDRPATVRVEREVRVAAAVDEAALEGAVRRLGWRDCTLGTPSGPRPSPLRSGSWKPFRRLP